jgi:2-alkyl-3-oxoalkanoate reductase
MKIIITGATGFVGAHLTRYFSRLGHEVLAVGRAPKPPNRLLDFAQYKALNWAEKMPILEADAVIHAAALASDSAKYSDLYAANVEGTRHLVAATAGCSYFVLISSSSVYAYRDNKPKIEADAGKDFNFLTNYGKTKWLSENVLMEHKNDQQKRLIIRPRAVYGVGDRVILPRLLGMVKGQKFIMPGPMNVETSQTNVEQIPRLIEHFFNAQFIEKQTLTFNLTDASSYKMGESLHAFLSFLYGKKLEKTVLPLAFLKLIARTGLSQTITKFLMDAVSYNCILDLTEIQKFYKIPPELKLQNESQNIKNWLNNFESLSPKNDVITSYLKNTEGAPWRI